MKVLVADRLEDSALEGLQRLEVELVYEAELSGTALKEALANTGADVLIVRSTKVTADVLEGSRLSVIIRAGAGVDTIDQEAASARGILVTNCPGKNSLAVAELAFGLILACDRRIPDNVASLREGKWNKKAFSKGRGLYGRTLGVVGTGRIAQEVMARARAFGMILVVHSRWMTPDIAAGMGVKRAQDLPELAAMSDVVTVHVALTAQTRQSIGEEFFASMRPGSIFVNTSRAEVVDQAALLKATASGRIFAGLDVFEGEPSGGEAEYTGPLKDAPNVYCTHHIGASTEQAQEAVASEVVRIVREFKKTGVVPNVVNVKKADISTHLLVVRHVDRVGVLAGVLGKLKDEGINVQEMENIVLGGARSAIAQIALDKEPSRDLLMKVKMDEAIFDASVFPINRTGEETGH